MNRFTYKFFRIIFKFFQSPRFRYSPPSEGLRRLASYDSHETVMQKAMNWAHYRRLGGDYMEFGVWEGDSFIKAFHFAKFRGLFSMRFFAFDSFTGYPPLEGVDKESGYLKEGAYRRDFDTFLNTFRKNIKKGGVDLGCVIIVPGMFEDLPTHAKGKVDNAIASLVWLDCDLYKSTLEALNFLVPYIRDGTALIFADWFTCNGNPEFGQPRAFYEWSAKHPEIQLFEYMNLGGIKMFVVSMPQGAPETAS